jgi:hypothetical protein
MTKTKLDVADILKLSAHCRAAALHYEKIAEMLDGKGRLLYLQDAAEARGMAEQLAQYDAGQLWTVRK